MSKLTKEQIADNKAFLDECMERWSKVYQRTKFPFDRMGLLQVGSKEYRVYKKEGERLRKYTLDVISKGNVVETKPVTENAIMEFIPRAVNSQEICSTVIKDMYDYKIGYADMQLGYNANPDVREKWLTQKAVLTEMSKSFDEGKSIKDVDLDNIHVADNYLYLYDVNIYNKLNKKTGEYYLSARIPTKDEDNTLVLNDQDGVSFVFRRRKFDSTYFKGNVQLEKDKDYVIYPRNNFRNKEVISATDLRDLYVGYLSKAISNQAALVQAEPKKHNLPRKEKDSRVRESFASISDTLELNADKDVQAEV